MDTAGFGLSAVSGSNRLPSPPARTTVRVASRIVFGSLMRLTAFAAGARLLANSIPFNNGVPLEVMGLERRLTAESMKVFPGVQEPAFVSRIAAGGMGVVYLAQDTRLY